MKPIMEKELVMANDDKRQHAILHIDENHIDANERADIKGIIDAISNTKERPIETQTDRTRQTALKDIQDICMKAPDIHDKSGDTDAKKLKGMNLALSQILEIVDFEIGFMDSESKES